MFRSAVCFGSVVIQIIAAPVNAETRVTEKQAEFGECRAYLQALAGALSGKLALYTTDTNEVLESTFASADGTTQYTVTCLANQEKMIIKEDTQ